VAVATVRPVTAQGWLDDVRTSYDTVAESYAELLRDSLERAATERAALAMFAELVRGDGGGPVLDAGCGTGRLTAVLDRLGLEVSGVDLSPGMVEVARREHPGHRYEVGSMTDLDVPDASLAGVVAWSTLIHVPEDEVPRVLAEFHRVLRPGGVVLVAYFGGEGSNHKTVGYGGHPMNVMVHKRTPARTAELLRAAGFTIAAELVLDDDPVKAMAVARRPAAGPS
jgi:ubiquinone/menaquinone biosynthesis C-methylase UbiE